jgi:hypothetical protein
MKTINRKRTLIVFCLLAGLMDLLSGALMMSVPAFTLKLMGVPPVAPEALVLISFIGAFVFSVGSLYWFALLTVLSTGKQATMRVLLTGTAWVRMVIFLFTTVALMTGALGLSWWSVPVTDGGLAIFQFWVVLYGWGFEND